MEWPGVKKLAESLILLADEDQQSWGPSEVIDDVPKVFPAKIQGEN